MVLLLKNKSLDQFVFRERLRLVEDSFVYPAHYVIMNTESQRS